MMLERSLNRKKTLGPDHPQTLDSSSSLGLLLQQHNQINVINVEKNINTLQDFLDIKNNVEESHCQQKIQRFVY